MEDEARQIAAARLPTEAGEFEARVYETPRGMQPLALVQGELDPEGVILARVHSECLTGEVFGSRRCDCGPQLTLALKHIGRAGGVLIYLRQEGRGIGLVNKLRAYALQDVGHDTVDANLALGFPPDLRDYGVAVAILRSLRISRVRLLTNNPEKIAGLERGGIAVVERIPLIVPPTPESVGYLQTKESRLGHLLDVFPRLGLTQDDSRIR